MNRSASSSSGSRPRSAAARGIPALREVVEQLRGPREQADGGRPRTSDVRDAVLTVLGEQPASGYRIVQVLQERDDERAPGAGQVYPTLQLLSDEGLVTAEETDGRRTWTLTAAGHAAAESAAARSQPWESSAAPDRARRVQIATSGAQLAQAAALAAQSTTPEQAAEVVAVLDEAKRRILSILVRS